MNPTPISEEARKAAMPFAEKLYSVNRLDGYADTIQRITEILLSYGKSAIDQACAAKEAECAELRKKQPINTHRRLFDLVRFMRAELHEADLLTNEEYAWLCEYTFPNDPKTGSPSPRRLEDYDDLRAQLSELEKDKRRIETLQAAADAVKDAEGNVTHLKLTIPDGNDVRKTLDSLGSAMSAQQGKGEA